MKNHRKIYLEPSIFIDENYLDVLANSNDNVIEDDGGWD